MRACALCVRVRAGVRALRVGVGVGGLVGLHVGVRAYVRAGGCVHARTLVCARTRQALWVWVCDPLLPQVPYLGGLMGRTRPGLGMRSSVASGPARAGNSRAHNWSTSAREAEYTH